MSKIQSPMLGYNNNVRHKNRVFHIQTEDSGVKKPHIITHLFMDGGRILKSVKTSYAEHVGADGMSDIVRGMMKDQHKAMFIALRDGQFDHLVDPGGPASTVGAKPATPATPSAPPAPAAPAAGPAIVRRATSPGLDATSSPPPPEEPAAVATPSAPAALSNVPRTTVAFAATIPSPPPSESSMAGHDAMNDAPLTMRDSVPAPVAELTLDIDALERAQEEAPAFKPQNDLPPPPATLFRKPDTGRYRALTNREEDTSPRPPGAGSIRPPASQGAPPRPSPSPSRPPPVAAKSPTPRPPAPVPPAPVRDGRDGREEETSQRYAPARPAAIFGQARPQQGSSIFGEDLISDKSLDEVILSYLAEDLETDGGKK